MWPFLGKSSHWNWVTTVWMLFNYDEELSSNKITNLLFFLFNGMQRLSSPRIQFGQPISISSNSVRHDISFMVGMYWPISASLIDVYAVRARQLVPPLVCVYAEEITLVGKQYGSSNEILTFDLENLLLFSHVTSSYSNITRHTACSLRRYAYSQNVGASVLRIYE